jgi:amino acid permease
MWFFLFTVSYFLNQYPLATVFGVDIGSIGTEFVKSVLGSKKVSFALSQIIFLFS